VRLSKMEKRLREASLAKSSSDTAECRWTQSDQTFFQTPSTIRHLTTFHARRTCSCEGMPTRDLSGLETKATSNSE
jgi:hypothetical protein